MHLYLEKIKKFGMKIKNRLFVAACIGVVAFAIPVTAHAFAIASNDASNESIAADVLEPEDIAVLTKPAETTTPIYGIAKAINSTKSTSTVTTSTSATSASTTSTSTTTETTTSLVDETTATEATETETVATVYDWSADFVKAGYEVPDYYGVGYSESDVVYIAKTLAQEAGDCSFDQRAAVCWTILNRCDYSGESIASICTAPDQFAYYDWKEYRADHYDMARDVLNRWCAEKDGLEAYRVLPSRFRFFWGDGSVNHFYIGDEYYDGLDCGDSPYGYEG